MNKRDNIGTVWAAECAQLQKDVLRGEWGFRGMVLSDYFGNYGYMNAERAIRDGTDIMLDVAGNSSITDITSGTSLQAMRQACKDIFYTTVNSATYENDAATAIPTWLMISYIVEGAVVAALILAEILLIRGYRKEKAKAAWSDRRFIPIVPPPSPFTGEGAVRVECKTNLLLNAFISALRARK